MSGETSPCPCEDVTPDGAPGPVADDEALIRFVPVAAWLVRDDKGRATLTPTAFPKDELARNKGKNVSLLRALAPPGEVGRRVDALNKELRRHRDPVVARATAKDLRQLLDKKYRRELCVNAGPITDELGFCAMHASVVREFPPLDATQRLEWTSLRVKLASQFAEVSHFSGAPVTILNS